jgi:hypothetical protein
MMFAKDSRAENMLTSHFGVAWKYVNNMTFDQLTKLWDAENKGRSKAKLDTAIQSYALRWENGSTPPAPILRSLPDAYDPLDGVQRLCAAHLRGLTRFSSYVVECDDEVTALGIRIFANKLLAGHPEPDDWSKARAVHDLIGVGKMSVVDVARMGGWAVKVVEDEVSVQKVGFALRCQGASERIHRHLLLAVSRHAKDEDLKLAPVADFVQRLHDLRFANGEAEPMIEKFFAVKRGKNPYDAFSIKLDEFLRHPETQARANGRRRSPKNPDVKLVAALKSVRTIIEDLEKQHCMIPYMDECYQIVNQIRDGLKRLHEMKTSKFS